MPKRLLVTDLEGTLLGDESSLARLSNELERPDAPRVAYTAGRDGFSAMQLLERSALAGGDYLIAGVGTEVYRRLGKRWLPIAQWPKLRAPWEPQRIRKALKTVASLRPQELRAESVYKISYVAPPAAADEVRQTLREAQIDADVIHSHGDALDVLPAGVDKGSATQWLAALIGVPMPATMTCGNMANDLGMLRLPCASVVVGNADARVLDEMPSLPSTHACAAPCAAGILERLRHFGWLNETGWTS